MNLFYTCNFCATLRRRGVGGMGCELVNVVTEKDLSPPCSFKLREAFVSSTGGNKSGVSKGQSTPTWMMGTRLSKLLLLSFQPSGGTAWSQVPNLL